MPLPPALLRDVERLLNDLAERRRTELLRRGERPGLGSFAEDAPFAHFLHASEEEQWRVVREELGLDPERYR